MLVKRLLLHPLVVWACRLIVTGVLLCAGVKKVWMPLEFARLLKKYYLLPDQTLKHIKYLKKCGDACLKGMEK